MFAWKVNKNLLSQCSSEDEDDLDRAHPENEDGQVDQVDLVDEEGGETKDGLLLHNGTLLLQAGHLELPVGGSNI